MLFTDGTARVVTERTHIIQCALQTKAASDRWLLLIANLRAASVMGYRGKPHTCNEPTDMSSGAAASCPTIDDEPSL